MLAKNVVVCSILALLGALIMADTSVAWPFGRIWEKRKAELYSQLSRDVSRRVHSRVDVARQELESSLDRQFEHEANLLREKLAIGSQELNEKFRGEVDSLNAAFKNESRALKNRFQKQLFALKQQIDSELALASDRAASSAVAEARKAVERADASSRELQQKTAAKLTKIEDTTVAELEKVIVATEKKIDGEVAKMKVGLQQRVAAISKRLQQEQALALKAFAENARNEKTKQALSHLKSSDEHPRKKPVTTAVLPPSKIKKANTQNTSK